MSLALKNRREKRVVGMPADFGSANGNRTRISALKGPRANRCTIAPRSESAGLIEFSTQGLRRGFSFHQFNQNLLTARRWQQKKIDPRAIRPGACLRKDRSGMEV